MVVRALSRVGGRLLRLRSTGTQRGTTGDHVAFRVVQA